MPLPLDPNNNLADIRMPKLLTLRLSSCAWN